MLASLIGDQASSTLSSSSSRRSGTFRLQGPQRFQHIAKTSRSHTRCPRTAFRLSTVTVSDIRRKRQLRIDCVPSKANGTRQEEDLGDGTVSVILLSGGVGKRMGASVPKQYLKVRGWPVALYSLKTFGQMREVGEIVVVCDTSWRHIFEVTLGELPKRIVTRWALPGKERQDSVFNGLQEVVDSAAVVAIHDCARPLVAAQDAAKCMQDAWRYGAAVLGVPVKPTIKEVDKELNVKQTLKRANLWEVQTPQCIQPSLLQQGFEHVKRENLEVTDDVSIIELLGRPVKITPGSYTNIKITTPDDMAVAEKFLEQGANAQSR